MAFSNILLLNYIFLTALSPFYLIKYSFTSFFLYILILLLINCLISHNIHSLLLSSAPTGPGFIGRAQCH